MSRSLKPFIAPLLAAAACAAFACAQPAGKPHATAELVSGASTIVAGEPFTVAVSFAIESPWHLYWKNPGDSGMPPSVKWTLPPGFTAGELRFPKPEVLKTNAGTNYIYEKHVALLVTITPPADLKDGETFELTGDAKWLECDADVCLPGKQTVTARVVAGKQTVSNRPAEFAAWESEVKAGETFDPASAK